MQIGPVTLDGHHVRLERVSLADVPALWRAGTYEEIRRYPPSPCDPRRRGGPTSRPNWPNKRPGWWSALSWRPGPPPELLGRPDFSPSTATTAG